jgi:hypothetical protein
MIPTSGVRKEPKRQWNIPNYSRTIIKIIESMEEGLKLGDHFSHDFGDETYSFPVETVIIHIDEEIAIVKVISITAE